MLTRHISPLSAQLVSFPSIMDESHTTGTTVPYPDSHPALEPYVLKHYVPKPYVSKPMYIPATPKRNPNPPIAPPKTPKFDPDIHGKELDLIQEDKDDEFANMIKRSPKKQPVDDFKLDKPPILHLEAVHVSDVPLPVQTEEERVILGENPAQAAEQVRILSSCQ